MTDVQCADDLLELGSRRRWSRSVRAATLAVLSLATASILVVVAARPDVLAGRGSIGAPAPAVGHTSTAPIPSPVRGHYFIP